MAEGLQVVIATEGMSEQTRNDLARELHRWIQQNIPQVRIETPEREGKPGEKGAEVIAGTLALFFTTGVAKSLVDCIAAWIRERRRAVKLEVTDSSGAKMTLSADNIGRPELDQLVTQLSVIQKSPGPTPTPRTPQPPPGPAS
jgi:hypothetical protein